MSIRLFDINNKQQQKAQALGARWDDHAKTWFIPDTIVDINPFKKWLPQEEGFIVQRPYFVARSKMTCLQCGKEMPLVTLGARFARQLVYETEAKAVWESWDVPVLFNEIEFLDEEIVESLRSNYPFFQRRYCKDLESEIWGNTCIYCHTLQEEFGEFRYEENALSPVTVEAAREIRIVYFKLAFDYFIRAGWEMNPFIGEVV